MAVNLSTPRLEQIIDEVAAVAHPHSIFAPYDVPVLLGGRMEGSTRMPILPMLMLDSGQIIPTEDLRYAACEMDDAKYVNDYVTYTICVRAASGRL